MPELTEQKLRILQEYSACDVSDALLKVEKVPKGTPANAGFLADLVPFSPSSLVNTEDTSPGKIIAPISTVQFIPKSQPLPQSVQDDPHHHGFPEGTHWVDHTKRDTVILLDQPEGQKCAILGGIMASRMNVLGAKAVLVNGRVRDIAELRDTGLPIWARGQSTVGAGAEAKPGARSVPIRVGRVTVYPGDIAFCDPLEGVVVIPQGLLDEVLALMPKIVAADNRVKKSVLNGTTVFEAFKIHRGT